MRCVNKRAGALLGAVLCVCACLVGCERGVAAPSSRPPASPLQPVTAPTASCVMEQKAAATSTVSRTEVRSAAATIDERAHDSAYQKRLVGDFRKEWLRIGQRRADIEKQMMRLREHATQKGLPPTATDEQVEAALEGGPKRAWGELIIARKACFAEEERLHAAARAAVAQRILRKEDGTRAQGAVPEAK